MQRNIHLFLIYALTAVGLLQSVGYIIHNNDLVFFALATRASPLPDVFGGSKAFEPNPYMAEFVFDFEDGSQKIVPKADYTNTLRRNGPTGRFFRFIGYIVVINWMPVIPESTYKPVLRHGFCTGGAIAELLGLKKPVRGFTILLNNAKDDGKPDYRYSVSCSD
ncbi:MAG: hypothetical protein KDD66_04660 [Bdellovibrionales bacterium]|nr:hypothetical protein [Bdellovibrionales bacterium]